MTVARQPFELEFERRPCPDCGAETDVEAETKCRPSRDATDEWVCAAEKTDAEGFFIFPTAESLARYCDWFSSEGPGAGDRDGEP